MKERELIGYRRHFLYIMNSFVLFLLEFRVLFKAYFLLLSLFFFLNSVRYIQESSSHWSSILAKDSYKGSFISNAFFIFCWYRHYATSFLLWLSFLSSFLLLFAYPFHIPLSIYRRLIGRIGGRTSSTTNVFESWTNSLLRIRSIGEKQVKVKKRKGKRKFRF